MRHAEGHSHDEGLRAVHPPYTPDHNHNHDHDHDHVHDDEVPRPLEDHPIWQRDNVTLHSVGIDIGSSGTQVVFSRLHLRRISEDLTSRYLVVRRDTLHRSPVALTPYTGGEHIDASALGSIIDAAYQAAAVDPAAVDTGVVILTGEALRRRNAQAIAGILAERGGELVTASAGHHMESMLAAYGSGAAKVSYETGRRILNIDVGGGTTKLALVDRGRITATAALHIGGRLQVVDDTGRITRLEPAGSRHATRAGFVWKSGDTVRGHELDRVAESMADALVQAVAADPVPAHVRDLYLTEPLPDLDQVDGVMFSGGVAEYVYGREQADFGDLGRRLGHALRRRAESGALPYPLLAPGECIRATALGASEHSVQLSGNTGYVSDPGALLPRRNLQVLRPLYELGETVDAHLVEVAIRRHLVALDVAQTGVDIVLALAWSGPPSHDRLLPFARGIRDALAERTAQGRPLYIVLDGDVALTLGRLLREELDVTADLFVVDGVSLRDFDYVDIGRIRLPSNTVPVTIKSLVFEQDPR
ncbi:ethanolamine ammonia-lyase reactivating factor EutA [Streptomyces sp. NPDC005917]|uniref:ethanolamine ammonia-lyase reactivating factor EutA n=1 Tax=unclassified Streptomyces TaxID=2593676 RepID=UPI0033CB10A1